MRDLSPEQLAEVHGILARLVPDREVWAFGSRVTGSPKPFSDLDLAIIGTEPLELCRFSSLKDAFADSNLPFRVDIVDWATTEKPFQDIISRAYTVLRQASSAS